jgi:hypothetical protein
LVSLNNNCKDNTGSTDQWLICYPAAREPAEAAFGGKSRGMSAVRQSDSRENYPGNALHYVPINRGAVGVCLNLPTSMLKVLSYVLGYRNTPRDTGSKRATKPESYASLLFLKPLIL